MYNILETDNTEDGEKDDDLNEVNDKLSNQKLENGEPGTCITI